MTSSLLLFANLVLALCFFSLVVHAQNSGSTEPTTSDSTSESGIDQALTPLYRMTNGFIKTVFPKGLRLDTISKVKDTLTEGGKVEGWPLTQVILNGYAGFATCIVVGFLMMVFMPFIGCFCCCCRLCGRCGGEAKDMDPKNGKCKRLLCGGLLMIFTLITVGGMVMVFFSASRIHDLVDKKIVDTELNSQLSALGNSLQVKVDEDIVNKTDALLGDLKSQVVTFLDDSSKTLTGAFLNMTHVEEPVTNLATELSTFNTSLNSLVESLEEFESLRNATAANYTRAQLLINGTSFVADPRVQVLVQVVQRLTDQIEGFTVQQVIDDLKVNATAKLNKIPNFEEAYKEVNSSISKLIESKIDQPRRDILKGVNSTTDQVSNQVNGIGDTVRQAADTITSLGKSISETLNSAKTYSSYGWYASIGLGSIIALICFLYLCGLAFGCGSRPGEASCHKGTGANFILAAVGFTFIFYSVLMLVTTISFSVGSLATSHACWVVQDPAPSIKVLTENDISVPELGNLTLLQVFRAYSDCLNNKTLGDILEYTDIGFSKSEITAQIDEQLGADHISKQIDGININTSSINFLPPNLNESLSELKDFDGFNSSNAPNLTGHVDTIKAILSSTITQLDSTSRLPVGTATDKTALADAAVIFEYSRDNGVDAMAQSAESIKANITSLQLTLDSLKDVGQKAFDAILKVENNIKNNASATVKTILSEYAGDLSEQVSTKATAGIDELFGTKCNDLANHLKDTVNVVCKTGLDPFNGFWFSLGWSLIMMIPCMICGLVLVSLFRRRSSYDGEYKDDFSQYVNHQNETRSRVKVYPSIPPRQELNTRVIGAL